MFLLQPIKTRDIRWYPLKNSLRNSCPSGKYLVKACIRNFVSFFFFFFHQMIVLQTCPSMLFFFIEKALFVLEIFHVLSFFPFFSTISRFKRTNGSGIIYVSWIGSHKFADLIFGITQKSLYITSWNLVR